MPQLLHEAVPLRRWRMIVPHAALLTLQSVPIVIVPAPANPASFYQIVAMAVSGNVVGGAYTNVNTTAILSFTGGNSSGPILAQSANIGLLIGAVNFVAVGGPIINLMSSNTASTIGREITMALLNAGSNLTGGNAADSLTVEVVTVEFNYDSTTP